jgi:hypothetical protein
MLVTPKESLGFDTRYRLLASYLPSLPFEIVDRWSLVADHGYLLYLLCLLNSDS